VCPVVEFVECGCRLLGDGDRHVKPFAPEEEMVHQQHRHYDIVPWVGSVRLEHVKNHVGALDLGFKMPGGSVFVRRRIRIRQIVIVSQLHVANLFRKQDCLGCKDWILIDDESLGEADVVLDQQFPLEYGGSETDEG